MKKTISILAIAGLVLALAPATQAALIDIVGGGGGVTASSEIADGTRGPENLINGVGLAAGVHDLATTNQWLSSAGGNPNWGGDDPDPWVLFDLGAVYTVDSMEVWNFSEADWSVNRGVNAVTVEYGLTAALGSTVAGITNLTIAPASAGGITGTTYAMGSVDARYIKIDIAPGAGIGNHGDTSIFYGMNEVQFDGTEVPEPATMSLLAIGGLALIRRRKRA